MVFTTIAYLFIIFAAFGGFLIAFYIHHTRKQQETMTCPMGADCTSVVNSRFAYFFGFPTTIWGMSYYILIAAFYAFLIILGESVPPELLFIAFGLSIVAVLFSAYLTAVQAFVLKSWCTWCLFSAGISVFILTMTILSTSFDLNALLLEYKTLIVTLHAVGAAIGVGAVTVTDFFFFKFLKDYRISHAENDVMKTLSQVIWVALAIGLLTGIGLYLPNSEVLLQTPKFLVKMILVFALIINGVILNIIITPRLVDISFGRQHVKQPGGLHRLRKLAFASGAFSIVSWYSVFLFGSIREWPFTFWQIFGVYLAIVTCAIIGSQIFDYLLSKGKIKLDR